MNGMWKAALSGVAVVFIAEQVVKTFTDANDSQTEQMMWRVASAALVGVAVAKIL